VQQEALTKEEVALLQPIAPMRIVSQSPQQTAQVLLLIQHCIEVGLKFGPAFAQDTTWYLFHG